MNIFQIYQKYHIPQNLQTHMYRVAAVGKVICNHIEGVSVDADLIVKTLLLHDMGNIVKFDLSSPKFLVASDQKRIEEFIRIRKQFKEKYGSHADDATIEILKELKVDQAIIDLCINSHGKHSHEIAEKDNWEKKIAYYCDMRVGPSGVLTLNDRFDDLVIRYAHHASSIKEYRVHCLEIERQLQEKVSIDLLTIDTPMLLHEIETLKNTKII